MNTNPIYIVDDDTDDEEILCDVMKELGLNNKLVFFHSANELLSDLKNNPVVPFIIISDINLPKIDGFELRQKILEETQMSDKSVPFIFWSTTASAAQIKKAYDLSAHGFFLKGRSYKEIKEGINEIIKYWTRSLSPATT
jgi:FixJ family two-component response regulator